MDKTGKTLKKNQTESLLNAGYLEKRLYRVVSRKSAIIGLAGTLAVRCLIPMSETGGVHLWIIIAGVFLPVVFGLGKVTNRQVCHQFAAANQSSERQIQQYLHFPAQIGIELFLLHSLAAIICTVVFALLFETRGAALVIPLAAWILVSVVTGLSAYLGASRLSASALEELIAQKGESIRKMIFEYNKRNFIGISLNTHYFIYVISSILLTFLLLWLLLLEDLMVANVHLPVRMALLSAMGICTVTVNTIRFFNYIKQTGRKIEMVVEKVLNGEDYTEVKTDSSSEIAYTAHLVNVIHLKTTEDQKRNEQKKQQLAEKLRGIKNQLPQVQMILDEGLAALEAELELLEKMTAQNDIIHTRIKEARTVARKTGETADESQKILTLNMQKMQEIAVANRTATAGIQSLSSKISGIWEIVDLIDSIADQTKIIAFNAELEAEKIDQNKDQFKNVAYAIRSLTDQVLDLTGKIRSDIKKIQEASTQLLEQGKSSTMNIEDGSAITRQLSATLKQMNSGADESVELSESVRSTVESLSMQITSLQKQLTGCRDHFEHYIESIRIESELVQQSGDILGAEE